MFCSLLLIVILSIACLSHGIELECEFVDIEFSDWGNKYTCKTKNLNIQQSNVIIESVNGRHQNGKSNIDVKQIVILNQNTEYFPHGLGNIFPRLKSINVELSNLKLIKREDFKGLENLKELSLYRNTIKVISDGTFDDLNLLEVLWMDQNKLKTIDQNIFKSMKKLRRADFGSNLCVDKNADTEVSIMDLQNEITEKCGISLKELIDKVKYLEFNLSMTYIEIANLSEKMFVFMENAKKIPFHCDFFLNASEYTCNARHLFVKNNNTKISDIRGHHHRMYSVNNVTTIHIHKQDTKFLPIGIISYFSNLKTLKVTKSNLVFIDNDSFIGMNNVNALILNGNSIEVLPEYVFDELHYLRIMDLSDNRITSLPPKTFYKLFLLEVLKLNDNRIQYLPSNLLSGNLNLRKIYFENNIISSIGSTIMQYLTESLSNANFRNNTCIDVKYPENTMDRLLIEILKCSELNDFIKKLLPTSFFGTNYIVN